MERLKRLRAAQLNKQFQKDSLTVVQKRLAEEKDRQARLQIERAALAGRRSPSPPRSPGPSPFMPLRAASSWGRPVALLGAPTAAQLPLIASASISLFPPLTPYLPKQNKTKTKNKNTRCPRGHAHLSMALFIAVLNAYCEVWSSVLSAVPLVREKWSL